jgi:hypothetical protein
MDASQDISGRHEMKSGASEIWCSIMPLQNSYIKFNNDN